MKKNQNQRKNQKALFNLVVLIVLVLVGFFGAKHVNHGSNTANSSGGSSSAPSSVVTKNLSSAIKQAPLKFENRRQMVMAERDSLGRARDSHIQLKNSQEPRVRREPLTFNPVGWHNYNFYYKTDNGGTRKAWLMSRGHLVGYQFCGLNNEPKNLVPETAWFNGGNYSGMDDSNNRSMLYYENRLDSWLYNHPNYYLDYQVTPLYKGNELVPRQIRLAYVGLDKSGDPLKIRLGGGREQSGNGGATVVVLDNISPNADINYATGTARNTVG